MAVTKIWTIKDSLQRVLDYAANPDKTEYDALAQTLHYAENDAKTKLNESAQLVTGIHCRADHAWEDMRAVQERFGKTDGVVALHAYQSFREGEVTPEQCHEIGVALARKVWGRRFQVLVATHMNTDNLHNHFVINSVSYVDGKKYEQRRSSMPSSGRHPTSCAGSTACRWWSSPRPRNRRGTPEYGRPLTKPVRMPALPRTSTGRCIGKGIFLAVTRTVGTQPSGRGMADEPCGFIGWEKNTIYLP